jgi:hypothetical protein
MERGKPEWFLLQVGIWQQMYNTMQVWEDGKSEGFTVMVKILANAKS